MKLPIDFYLQTDVVKISRSLLGKVLVTCVGGIVTHGIITETEAYAGIKDKASHAYGGRRTARNEVMYHQGGKAYIYICYGLHHLFNVVSNAEGIPDAVLVRGIFPLEGVEAMVRRRKVKNFSKNFTTGPGKVSQALGIDIQFNGILLTGNQIWIEDVGIEFSEKEVQVGHRVGVGYAGEDAFLPYRFRVNWETASNYSSMLRR